MNQQKHPFHLVDPSPWPFLASFAALLTTFGGVMYMHGYIGGDGLALTGFLMILYTMFVWWRDIIRESTYQGHHTTTCLLYTSPSPRDATLSRMPSSA